VELFEQRLDSIQIMREGLRTRLGKLTTVLGGELNVNTQPYRDVSARLQGRMASIRSVRSSAATRLMALTRIDQWYTRGKIMTEDTAVAVKQTRTSDAGFITIWQAAESAEIAADALGLHRNSAMQRAAKLRKEGMNLKKFKTLSFGREVRDAAYIERMNALCAEHYVDGDNIVSDDWIRWFNNLITYMIRN
jgi:hypothetical protein